MRNRVFAGLAFLTLTAVPMGAQTVEIGHEPVGCAVAKRFPRLEARFAPGDAVAAARVVFQPENTLHWYSVAMKAEGPAFSGVLPQPKKGLKAFQYYIEVTDRALGTSRTANYTTTVAATAAACQGKVVAGSLGSASVLLQAPEGAAAVPVGFASTGVVPAVAGAAAAAGAAAGATGAAAGTGAAAAGAGGGGGLSTGALVGIVAAGAAAAGAAVVITRGTTYAGTFNTEMVLTAYGCGVIHAMSGTVEIALEESGGSATGPMDIFVASDTATLSSGPGCAGAGGTGPGISNKFGCVVTGSPSNLACNEAAPQTFETTTATNTTSFTGSLSGGVISGMLTLATTGLVGGRDAYGGSTTFPISLR